VYTSFSALFMGRVRYGAGHRSLLSPKYKKEINMEILENNYTSFKYTCRQCYSVLKVTVDDLLGGDVSNFSIQCPACKKNSPVSWNQVPKRVQEQIK
jgi:hypothetical protein